MEKDNDLKGNGNSYDFGARIYDPRIGRWLSMEPLFTKYPNISVYAFSGNSPVVLKDPDGKQIIIYYKDENDVEQSLIYNPGDEYTGTNDFVQAVFESFDYLTQNDVGYEILELAASTEILQIRQTIEIGDTEFYTEDGEDLIVKYNPWEGLKVTDFFGKEGKQSPATGFLHELAHALGYIKDPVKMSSRSKAKDKQYYTKEERRVIRTVENPATYKLGEGMRDNHGGTPFKAVSPSSTEERAPEQDYIEPSSDGGFA